MLKTYILCIDFERIRQEYWKKYDNGVQAEQLSEEYFDRSQHIREELLKLFPNRFIDLSLYTYLILTEHDIETLYEMVMKVFSKIFLDDSKEPQKKDLRFKNQFYLAVKTEFRAFTYPKKQSELECLLSKQC